MARNLADAWRDVPHISLFDEVDAVAVASRDGLVVPVVHDAHERDVVGLGQDVARVTEAGRAGHLAPEMVRGATFTVTNFGTEGGRFATPIVRGRRRARRHRVPRSRPRDAARTGAARPDLTAGTRESRR